MTILASGFALLIAALQGQAYVADGSTLVIRGTAVLLSGIDVPDRRSPQGEAARAEVQTLVADRVVMCRSSGERRGALVLATCTIDGEDLGAMLVERGLALDCARDSEGRYRSLEPLGSRERLTQSAHCNM
ncbi:MAG: thermonuclease family protein [Pseudomonadota bacterium]